MSNKLIIASAGAGKTHRIAEQSVEMANNGQKVLIVTYTESNQSEILSKCKSLGVTDLKNIVIKGWYTFLLEDLIRPYQAMVFDKRIEAINFNSSNPHMRGGRTIAGTSEKVGRRLNPRHFLTSCNTKAHTEFLSKLALRISVASARQTISRLSAIYQHLFIDEVQDLAGWDFDVLKYMARADCDLTCVGDFRQTIYSTSSNPKQPKTNQQKLNAFGSMGFEIEHMAISRRCIQLICDYADTVHRHDGYNETNSLVDEVPEQYADHLGVFIVSRPHLQAYLRTYEPVILRASISSARFLNDTSIKKVNFGMSKGLGFNRTLVIPTDKIKLFLRGNLDSFDGMNTDKARNNFYVACTRARYSLAFLMDEQHIGDCTLPIWEP